RPVHLHFATVPTGVKSLSPLSLVRASIARAVLPAHSPRAIYEWYTIRAVNPASLSEFFRAAHRSLRRPHSPASIESTNSRGPVSYLSAPAVSLPLLPLGATA